ncbi:DUF4365 domain-containing protein [Nonomuraea sp. NPDC050556]|uniref:DUF4365 domain-containing protein n=1 Tax=Nonomuraea sp. NPDC050556 TaxID=3364369 RepID=UPI0037BC08F5
MPPRKQILHFAIDARGEKLPRVPKSRRPERAAVNALRALLEQHDHIVQEIDGQNDFGEDLHVTFTEDHQVTGDMIKVQVKGGNSWRRAGGYGVPVGHHASTWADGNVPVFCVVHDPESDVLYWANATKQLLEARRDREALTTITVNSTNQLDDASLAAFVLQARQYANRYQGNQALRIRLGEMAGVEFEASDLVVHFVNRWGEDLIFWQRQAEGFATLLHSDLDWEPRCIWPEALRVTNLRVIGPVPMVADVILDEAELMWLTACFEATGWARRPLPDREPAERGAADRGEYGFSARVGWPSAKVTSRRELVTAKELVAGERIYWLSQRWNERGRLVSEVWESVEAPGAVCVRFDQLMMADTFWPAERFARRRREA